MGSAMEGKKKLYMHLKPLGSIVGLHPIKLKRMEKVKIHFPAEFFHRVGDVIITYPGG